MIEDRECARPGCHKKFTVRPGNRKKRYCSPQCNNLLNHTNSKKHHQLGMNFSTASNRLRKLVLFKLVVETDRDICFRCGKKILSADDCTIEHKESWQHKSTELFWDLNNIAFSHSTCNTRARNPGKHSDEFLLEEIRKEAVRLGRTPSERVFRGELHPVTYRKRFGSWGNALRLAGFEPNKRGRIKKY